MLQIKNTLGGGKPEGMYVWKKSSFSYIDSITTQTRKNYTLGNATSDTTVYYSTSYTLDETAGTYTLVNPKSATLQYAQWSVYSVEMVKSNYYIWGSTSSNEIYTTNASSTYNVYLKNSDGKVFLESDSANYKYDIHSAKIEYTFLDYVVSDKKTAYPDGGEKGGYWYEKVVNGIDLEKLGCTKFEEGSFTPSGNASVYDATHSLGVIPKFAIVYGGIISGPYFCWQTYPISTSGNSAGACVSYEGTENYTSSSKATFTSNNAELKINNGGKFKAGIEYHYLLLA